jgi:hypothetical protein
MTQETTPKPHGGGPKTPAGKARSAMNATKHGLTAKSVVIADEDPAEFQVLLDQYVADFAPETGAERDLVREMAVCQWRLQRSWKIESAMFDMAVGSTEERVHEEWEDAPKSFVLATAWKHMADDGSGYKLLDRYETRLTRRYDKAIATLRQLKADRKSTLGPAAMADPKICETNSLLAFLEETVAGPEICQTNSVEAVATEICETNSTPERENYQTNSPAGPDAAKCETNSPVPSLDKYKDQRWPSFIPPEYSQTPFRDLPQHEQWTIMEYERILAASLGNR